MIEYKIVVLGSGGVGKSTITVQFVRGLFIETYDPTIEDSYRKTVQIDGQLYILEILDTAGTEQFATLRDLYIRKGQGFIFVYSVTSKNSLFDLQDLRQQIIRIKNDEIVPMILVGNKCDLEDDRKVSKEEGETFAKEFKCSFLETSAKSEINISEIFTYLVRQINEKHRKNSKKSNIDNICNLL